MKKIAFLSILAVVLLVGCAVEDFDPADIIVDYNDIIERTVDDYGQNDTLYIYARKSWNDGQAITVDCQTDNTIIERFNEKNGEQLLPLPQDYYNILNTTQQLVGDDIYAIFEIAIDKKVFSLKEGGGQYAIGCRILKDKQPLKVSNGEFVLKVNLRTPTLKFEEPLSITHIVDPRSKTTTIKLPIITNFINKDWMTFDLDTTNSKSKIEAYNAKNSTQYQTAIVEPSQIVWIQDSLILNRGESRKELQVHMDYLEHVTTQGVLLPISLSNIKTYNRKDYIFKPDKEANTIFVIIKRKGID